MTDWQIRLPYRYRDESYVDVASNARALEGDESQVVRQLVISARLDGVAETAGELLDYIDGLEPPERRELLDRARVDCGLPTTAEVDAHRQRPLIVRTTGAGGGFPNCADPDCNAVPMRAGIFFDPGVARWWCDAHVDQAGAGDMEPVGSGIVLSPSGVPIPYSPAADAADREREASDRARREKEAAIRAVEAAELAASKRARDEAHRQELPEHLRRMAPA
jgi:hypothetical protein